MHRKAMLSVAILLTWSATSARTPAKMLTLAWDYPHSAPTPAWRLTVVATVHRETAQTHLILTPLDDALCQQHAGKTYHAGVTWCAALPCPDPGAYTLLLQADQSLPSNVLDFGVDATCHLTTYAAALQAQQPPSPEVQASPLAMASAREQSGQAPMSTEGPTLETSTPETATSPPPAPSPPVVDMPDTPVATPDVGPPALSSPTGHPEDDPPPSTAPSPMPTQLQTLWEQFAALEAAYRTELQRIETAYETALQQQRHPLHAYRLAWQQQQAVYQRAQQHWAALFARYQQLLLGQPSAGQEPR